jgi:hypothetical protein
VIRKALRQSRTELSRVFALIDCHTHSSNHNLIYCGLFSPIFLCGFEIWNFGAAQCEPRRPSELWAALKFSPCCRAQI